MIRTGRLTLLHRSGQTAFVREITNGGRASRYISLLVATLGSGDDAVVNLGCELVNGARQLGIGV